MSTLTNRSTFIVVATMPFASALVRRSEDSALDYISVRTSGSTPQFALIAARSALNALLDSMVVGHQLPLTIFRLELLEEGASRALASEVVLPYSDGRYGDLGGIWQFPLFAPYLSALREALTTTSPYYRLLCAWRVYGGVKAARRRLHELIEQPKIVADLLKDPQIDPAEMDKMGVADDFSAKLRTAGDLFKELDDMRQAAAHFELKTGVQLDLSLGENFRNYSIASALLLRYSWQSVHDLRAFYSKHLDPILSIGSILPERARFQEFFARGE